MTTNAKAVKLVTTNRDCYATITRSMLTAANAASKLSDDQNARCRLEQIITLFEWASDSFIIAVEECKVFDK